MIIGCDFHPSWQQIAWLDSRDWGNRRRETGACLWRCQVVLRAGASSGVDWHGGHGQQSVVHGNGAGSGTRDLDRGCGADPGQLRAPAEDRQTGRGAYSEAGGGRAVSAVVDSGPRATGSAAVGAAPAQTGGDSQPGKERTATPFSEPRDAAEAQTVESGGTEVAARVTAETLGGVPARRLARVAGDVRRADRKVGSSGAACRRRAPAGPVADDAARSGFRTRRWRMC